MNPTALAVALLDARWAKSPRFTPDGRLLQFISTLSGVAQRWEVDLGGTGWPRQCTFYPEGIQDAIFSPRPDTPTLLCHRDPTGTGRTQLYLTNDAATPGTLLTEGYPSSTHTFCGWADDGAMIYFAANRRRRDRYDLYQQALDVRTARCVWENEDPGFLSSFRCAPDGRHVLVRRTPSNIEHSLIEIDLTTGQSRTLSDAGPASRYQSTVYAPDGHSLYVATDRGADFLYLARLHLADATLEPLATPEGDVEHLVLSDTGKRLAYTVNVDGYSALYLREVSTGITHPAPLGQHAGLISDLTFDPGEGRLAFTMIRPDRPADIFLWDLGTDSISQVTHTATRLAATAVVPELVWYESFDGRHIPAWFFRPAPASSRKHPAVVYLHGGPEAQLRPVFNPLLQFLVGSGFAVLAPNVRGSTGYGKAYSRLDDGRLRWGAVHDAAYAARWLRDRPDVDGERVAVCGESYGGFLTLAALAHHPDLWTAGISIAGMSSLVTFLQRIDPVYRAYREAEYGSLSKDRDFLVDVSPLTHAHRINMPVLLIHGARDPRVPLHEAEQFAGLLRAHGVPVQHLVFDDEGHTIANPADCTHAWITMVQFLQTCLAGSASVAKRLHQTKADVPDLPFSQTDLAEMAARSATLDERLRGEVLLLPATDLHTHTAHHRTAWCQAAASADPVRFTRRLAWDGLDEAAAHRLLGSVVWPERKALPGWTETLTAALLSQTPPSPDPKSNALPFSVLVQPFVEVARRRLVVRAGGSYHALNDAAHQRLAHGLLRTLVELAHPVLSMRWTLLEARNRPFHLGEQRTTADHSEQSNPALYRDFIEDLHAGGLAATLRDYPVLARLLATATDLWVDAQAEFLERLAADWTAIQARFQPGEPLGLVVDVQPQLSDRHNGGRSVIACTFASGLKVIYKPRAVGLEVFYNNVLAWVNAQSGLLPLKTLAILDRSTYGWMEYARPAPCLDEDAAHRFYRRMGYLLGLLYVLHGTDCHHENLFACGEHPVIIDAEMLAVPRLREPSPKRPHTRAVEAVKTETILETGLLPRWERSPGGPPFDMSALLAGHPAHRDASAAEGISSSSRSPSFRTSRATPSAHLPTLHGLPLDALDFVDEIVGGFEEMYAFLCRHRVALLATDGPLAALADQQVRVIFRDTRTYARLLRTALHPKYLRDGMARSIHLEQMARGYHSADGAAPFNWPMLAAERQALAGLDVPHFTTRADRDVLVLPTGACITSCFEASSLARIHQRLAHLGDEDRERQAQIIRSTMMLHRRGVGAPPLPPEPPVAASETVLPMMESALVEEALSIAHALIDQALPLAGDSLVWLASERLRPARHCRLAPTGYSLYEGNAGIAVFLGAVAYVTEDGACRTAACRAISFVREALDSEAMDMAQHIGLGGGDGLGGVIYALTHLHRFLGDPALLETANHAATLIMPERIVVDTRLDVLAGSAGAMLGLLALYEKTADAAILARAEACGRHLLASRVPTRTGHRAWETVTPGRVLTGMSHGAAGIAYALVRLHAHTHDTSFLDAAREALAYERAVFDAEAGNWPDFRAEEQPSFWTTWCHGAPGIGLARLGCLAGMQDDRLQEELDVALATTLGGGLGPTDHLCCGNFGRIDLFIEAAQQREHSDLLPEARRQAALCVDRARQHGGYRLPNRFPGNDFAPSFFMGRAGVGYQLLRLAYPDVLPSVLMWA